MKAVLSGWFSFLITLLAVMAFSCCAAHPQTDSFGRTARESGRVCVEDYLHADTTHGGTDYGAAITAADSALALTSRSSLEICASGDHPIYSTAVLDRPISFDGNGSTLVVQPSLSSTPVTTSATSITAGNNTIQIANTKGLAAGMAIGGTGLPSAETIASVDGPTSVTLSLAPNLYFVGVPDSGSSDICGLSTMIGLAVGQEISGFGVAPGSHISALAPAKQCITLSRPVSSVQTIASVQGSATGPSVFHVLGTWISPVTAVITKPAVRLQFNPSAMHNHENAMVGIKIRGLHIADRSNGGDGRSLSGVQGLQIYGWDRVKVEDLEVSRLLGSALILGGYNVPGNGGMGTVRESQFRDIDLRDSGDPATGQSTLELMNPPQSGDRINQIDFSGTQVVFPYAEGITIGDYRKDPLPVGLIWFTNNTQIEGGSHIPHQNINAPFDLIGIQNGWDIHFAEDSIISPGFGKAAIRVDKAYSVTVIDSYIAAFQKAASYQVSVSRGSKAIKYISGGNGAFPAAPLIDGDGAILTDTGSCSSGCPVWVAPQEGAGSTGTSLKITAPYSGNATTAKLELAGGGYYIINTGDTFQKATFFGNSYGDMRPKFLERLGLTDAGQEFIAGIAPKQSYVFDSPSLGILTIGPKRREQLNVHGFTILPLPDGHNR